MVLGVEAIEGAGALDLVDVVGAGPEAAAAVAGAVVHPQLRPLRLDRRDECDLVALDGREAVSQRNCIASAGARDHTSDRLPDLERPVGARGRMEPVDDAGHDVDPQELAAPGVPHGPLAEL